MNPGRSVLVVEDDADIRRLLCEFLEGEGLSVRSARNGREALDVVLGNEPPYLILLDLMMPVMDGFGFLNSLREIQPNWEERMHIVVVTAAGQKAAESTGVKDILKKPLKIEDLIRVLNLN